VGAADDVGEGGEGETVGEDVVGPAGGLVGVVGVADVAVGLAVPPVVVPVGGVVVGVGAGGAGDVVADVVGAPVPPAGVTDAGGGRTST
jgi:hypothetical protein